MNTFFLILFSAFFSSYALPPKEPQCHTIVTVHDPESIGGINKGHRRGFTDADDEASCRQSCKEDIQEQAKMYKMAVSGKCFWNKEVVEVHGRGPFRIPDPNGWKDY